MHHYRWNFNKAVSQCTGVGDTAGLQKYLGQVDCKSANMLGHVFEGVMLFHCSNHGNTSVVECALIELNTFFQRRSTLDTSAAANLFRNNKSSDPDVTFLVQNMNIRAQMPSIFYRTCYSSQKNTELSAGIDK